MVFVFLDPRPSAPIYLIKIKTLYLFKIFKKLFRMAKLWCPKYMEKLFITVVFF